jgi:hypothetical protein
MQMHANNLQGLKARENQHSHVFAMSRYCTTKSLNSPQTLGVLEEKFQHFDLPQRELRYFQNKFLVNKCNMQNPKWKMENEK